MTTSEKIAIAGMVTSAIVSIVTALISRRNPSKEDSTRHKQGRTDGSPTTVLTLIKLVLWAIIVVTLIEGAINLYEALLSFQANGRASALPHVAVVAACITVLIIALTIRKRLPRVA